MSSIAAGYQLPGFTGLLTHGWKLPRMARDIEPDYELDAQVRSGDYFIMIATALDLLGRKTTDYELKIKLEAIVSDLIYLQDNYTITKNEHTEQ